MTDRDSIEDEIGRAVSALKLTSSHWERCSEEKAREIVREAKERFVEGNPRSWWLALKGDPDVHSHPDGNGMRALRGHIPPMDMDCWFIPETEEEELPVYDVRIDAIADVLGKCSYFEYYLVGKRLDWLIVENDHNDLVVVRLPLAPNADRT